MKRLAAAAVVAFFAVIVGVAFAGSGTEQDPYGPGDHVAICHATGSATNPYVYIEPSATSGGPAGHGIHEGDIYAGYYFQQNANADVEYVAGSNEDMLALLDAGCEADDPDPTDVCANLEGVQEEVPEGLELVDGNCVEPQTPEDVCPNIEGVQETIPDGFVLDNDGNCVQPDEGEPPVDPPANPPTVTPDAPPSTTPAQPQPGSELPHTL